MSWDINLVDVRGEKTDLNANLSGMSAILNASKTFKRVCDDNHAAVYNDGDVVRLRDLMLNRNDISKDITQYLAKEDAKGERTFVAEWYLKLFALLDEHCVEDDDDEGENCIHGLAFW